MRKIFPLSERNVFDWTGVRRKENQAGEFAIPGRDPWRGITAQAVPQEVDAIRGHLWLTSQHSDGAHRVLHGFLLQRKGHVAHLVSVGQAALVVPEHHNSAR